MYRLVYKDAHQYVANRDGVVYYVQRVPQMGKKDNQAQLSAAFGAPISGVNGLGKCWRKPAPHRCLNIDCFIIGCPP